MEKERRRLVARRVSLVDLMTSAVCVSVVDIDISRLYNILARCVSALRHMESSKPSSFALSRVRYC